MKKIILILLFFVVQVTYSQSLSVFKIDTSSFPIIKAKFYAYDANGNQITNLSPSDFKVTENGQIRTVTFVSCPPQQPPQKVSVAMSLDISGSMCQSKKGPIPVELGKTTAKELCKKIAMPPSEFALQQCNNIAYIVQDFSMDRNKIISKINSITAGGDNDFVEQLLNQKTGLLNIAKTGRNKRVAVIYTDAWWSKLPNNELQHCIDTCLKYNISFYTVIYTKKEAALNGIKESLRQLSNSTGGQFYDGITSYEAAEMISSSIQESTQGGDPCEIEWKSAVSCSAELTDVKITLIQNGLESDISYQIPIRSVAKLEIKPVSVKFINPQPGIKKDTIITVTARNSNFNISNITSSNPAFKIAPTNAFLNDGQSMILTVSYIPADSGYTYTKFEIENDVCPKKYYASGGFRGIKPTVKTLKLIHPNGNEVFVAGSDTIITWEGVLPEEPVKIDYSTNNGVEWILIADSISGLSYNWRIPKTPSNQCLARVTAKTTNLDSYIEMVLVPKGTFEMGNTSTYQGDAKEKPVHTVTISHDFLLGKYEITQMQYEEIMGSNPSHYVGSDLPVEQVSWYNAIDFCNKLSDMEGLEPCYTINGMDIQCNWNASGYRLPTEAEWEYACKSETETDFYSGDLINPICDPIDINLNNIGWYCGNSGDKTHDVGQKELNLFGLYDMSGNVWEWCWDWYSNSYYAKSPKMDPKGENSGSVHILRGGSYQNEASMCRSSIRISSFPVVCGLGYGFRVARTY